MILILQSSHFCWICSLISQTSVQLKEKRETAINVILNLSAKKPQIIYIRKKTAYRFTCWILLACTFCMSSDKQSIHSRDKWQATTETVSLYKTIACLYNSHIMFSNNPWIDFVVEAHKTGFWCNKFRERSILQFKGFLIIMCMMQDSATSLAISSGQHSRLTLNGCKTEGQWRLERNWLAVGQN